MCGHTKGGVGIKVGMWRGCFGPASNSKWALLTLPVLPQTVFRPPLDMYDVLIRLSPRHIPRHRQAVDSPAASFCRGLLSEPGPSSLMPVLGYDPPQLYVAQLRVGPEGLTDPAEGIPRWSWAHAGGSQMPTCNLVSVLPFPRRPLGTWPFFSMTSTAER